MSDLCRKNQVSVYKHYSEEEWIPKPLYKVEEWLLDYLDGKAEDFKNAAQYIKKGATDLSRDTP